jgi:hypothetical protein
MNRILLIGAWVFPVLAVLAAINTLVTDRSARFLCRRSCWINELLYGLFGDDGAKIGLAIMYFTISVFGFFLAYRMQRKQ